MKTSIFLIVCFCLALAYGWIHNIVLLVRMDCGMCGLEIARIAGIFVAPLGVILGFIS